MKCLSKCLPFNIAFNLSYMHIVYGIIWLRKAQMPNNQSLPAKKSVKKILSSEKLWN